jgi:hypothetical protein
MGFLGWGVEKSAGSVSRSCGGGGLRESDMGVFNMFRKQGFFCIVRSHPGVERDIPVQLKTSPAHGCVNAKET